MVLFITDSPSPVHSSPKMGLRTIVDQTFYIVFTIGAYAGARLFRAHHKDDARLWPYMRKLIFLIIFCNYCFGLICMILMALPIPDKRGSIKLDLDVYTGYALTWGGYMLDGFICFVTINWSTNYLIEHSGYVDRCRETPPIAEPTMEKLKKWKRSTIFIIIVFVGLLVAQGVVTAMAALDVVQAPVHMGRVSYWSGMSLQGSWTALGVTAFIATAHIGYHCIFFCNQCEITRLHLRTFNEALSEEKAVTMQRRRLDMYHAEYCRMIAMVQNLDHSFRESTFCQLSLVTIGSCLMLYLYSKARSDDWGPLIFVTFTLSAILFTFSFTVIPAVMLDNQISRPKSLIRAWYLKYEQHTNVYECEFDEKTRQALGLFMSSVHAEDASITVASLAKLNAQLLLTLASLVLTYFLVIVQFDQTNCTQNMANITKLV